MAVKGKERLASEIRPTRTIRANQHTSAGSVHRNGLSNCDKNSDKSHRFLKDAASRLAVKTYRLSLAQEYTIALNPYY